MSEATIKNQKVILQLFSACGPQEYSQLVNECFAQGVANYNVIDSALQLLIDAGLVEKELIEPEIENDDSYYVYDLANFN